MVEMKGSITTLTNPEDSADVKSFTYDYSYWSYDGFKEQPDSYFAKQSPNSVYADQVSIYDLYGYLTLYTHNLCYSFFKITIIMKINTESCDFWCRTQCTRTLEVECWLMLGMVTTQHCLLMDRRVLENLGLSSDMDPIKVMKVSIS